MTRRHLSRLGRSIFAVLLCGLVVTPVLAQPIPGRAAPQPTVGVTPNQGPGGEADAYRLFLRAGANGIEAPQPWSTLAPAPDRFRLADIRSIVRGVRSVPATRIMLIPAAIETTHRAVPHRLQHAAWDSRRMITRYRTLIKRLAPDLSRQVAYVSIANEADVYFTLHPRELPTFVRFAHAELTELHRLLPWAKAGVTVTYGGLAADRPHVARALARLGNATIVTYYPLANGYRVRSPRSPLRDIPHMIRLAHGRTLVVQEAGYPSASRLGSSPSAQATFVRNVFAAWARVPRRIPFLSFYSLFDLPARECGAQSDQTAFLCSLGLRDRGGRPKPAWAAFRMGLRSVR